MLKIYRKEISPCAQKVCLLLPKKPPVAGKHMNGAASCRA